MTIGETAKRTGCTPATIRFYEESGLVKAAERTASGRRVYGWPDIHRLRFIRRCRDLGFALEEIRALLGVSDGPSTDCLAVRDLARVHIDRLAAMRAEIDAVGRALSSLADSCDVACRTGRSPDCRIIEDLAGAAG